MVVGSFCYLEFGDSAARYQIRFHIDLQAGESGGGLMEVILGRSNKL